MKRAIIGIVSFLAIAAIGLFLYLSLTDFSEYRADIEKAVAEATGREFSIGGEFTLDAVPLVLIAEEVTWANPDWASDDPMLSVGHVTVRIDSSSLLFGPLLIEEFLLRDVRVIVEEDEAQLIAGLSGYTAWGWLFTQWLWVAPLHRSQGLASALLTRAEAEAQSRGCIGAHIDTFSERALNLYQRQGYEIFGQIPDFVGGQTRSFLSKRWA